MKVLGIKCSGHDTGAACISDESGELKITAISEARLNRRKHSYTYPLLSIDYVLKNSGITSLNELDIICIDRHGFEWPEVASQVGRYYARNKSKGKSDYDAKFNYLIEQSIRFPKNKVVYVPHIDAHAASAYYVSGFSDAAILTIEGGMGLYRGEGRELKVIHRTGYGEDEYKYGEMVANTRNCRPISRKNISNLYDLITRKLGLDEFAAGKTMALAAFRDSFPITNHLEIPKDRHAGFFSDYTDLIQRLEATVPQFSPKTAARDSELLQEYWVNIAREAQDALEEDVLYYAEIASKDTNAKNLCLAGGVALSCVTNRKILDLGLYENVFVQPAASDEGIPLGCALFGYYKVLNGQKTYKMNHAYLGVSNDSTTLPALLSRWQMEAERVAVSTVAKVIAEGKIIGRCFGPSEYGPRALGNRSILADPRIPNMLDIVNTKIKHRERYRPFAPSSHEEKQHLYFDLPVPSPFMLMACKVVQGVESIIPAVMHVDATSRVQTVRRDQNAGYYDLIDEFGKITGVYVLLNTSFNDDGEPIVENYEDALLSFLRTGLNYLYIEGYLIPRPTEEKCAKIREALGKEVSARVAKSYEAAIEEYCDGDKYKELEVDLNTWRVTDIADTIKSLVRQAIQANMREHGKNLKLLWLRKTANRIARASRYGKKGILMGSARFIMVVAFSLRSLLMKRK